MAVSVKSFSMKVLRIALLVLVFMTMAGIGTYVTLRLMIRSEDTVIVPELVGKDVLVALELLSDLGLNTRVKGTRYDNQTARHHILEQDPEPGSAIKRGRDVRIQVSRGPESIAMPNLSGLSLQQGRILLTENGLCQGAVSRMDSSRYPFDRIMTHSPPPGRMVNRNSCVDILASQGKAPPATIMSDFRGLPLETAIRLLEQRQLDLGRIHSVHQHDAPLDVIVAQAPPAGYRVAQDGLVDLTVNRFPTDHRPSPNSAELFRFKTQNGFLNQRVQVKINQPQLSISLFDDFMRPGQEIWLLIPKSGNPTVLVYVDGQLVDSRTMDGI